MIQPSWKIVIIVGLLVLAYTLKTVYELKGPEMVQNPHRIQTEMQEMMDTKTDENITKIILPTIPNTSPDTNALVPTLLILYTYSETPNARLNLEYFIQKGIHSSADFIFVFNGDSSASSLLPSAPNIKTVQRDNTCFDLGTIGEVLLKDSLWKKYTHFITLNASVRGPFLPIYSEGSCWTDLFLSCITDKVKLVGTTFNCIPRPHVQSILLATDSIGMAVLLDPALATSASIDDWWGSKTDPSGFTPCYSTLKLAVHGEVALTELIRSQGYEIDVMMAVFHGATPTSYCSDNGSPDDILYNGHYYGMNVHPYELVFIKANRDIDPALLSGMTKWHLAQETTS